MLSKTSFPIWRASLPISMIFRNPVIEWNCPVKRPIVMGSRLPQVTYSLGENSKKLHAFAKQKTFEALEAAGAKSTFVLPIPNGHTLWGRPVWELIHKDLWSTGTIRPMMWTTYLWLMAAPLPRQPPLIQLPPSWHWH